MAKVGAALNGLADRIDEVIAVERAAVADLSHRLRTPLTALRLQVEALPDRERGRSDRGSTGLGLDIARRGAEAAGGHLTIHKNQVTLTLSAP